MKLWVFPWALMGAMLAQPTFAETVTRNQALEQARAFAASRGLSISISTQHMAKAKTTADDAALYFFDTDGDNGFVIVAADDRAVPILGYTLNGHYDEASMPGNMRAWIDGYARQISSLPADAPKFTRATSTPPAVEPIVKTRWNQYRAACPENSLAGCVATSMAQAIYCYKYPADLPALEGYTATNYGTIEVPALPGIKNFAWDDMSDSYDTEPGAEEPVSLLMRYCGQAAHMQYGVDASASTEEDAAFALRTMGYSSANCVMRDKYSYSEWHNLIYNELASGHPVMYGGADYYYSGHDFICDGYDGNGNFHINWGWGGWFDGYFTLDALAPNNDFLGYNYEQKAVVNIYPTDEVLPMKTQMLNFSYRMNEDILDCAYWNTNGETLGFDLGMGYESVAGNISDNWGLMENKVLGNTYYVIAAFPVDYFDFPADGIYHFFPVSKVHGTTEWLKCSPSNESYAKIKRSGDKNTVVAMHDIYGTAQTFTSIGEAGMATFWTDHAAVIPEGVKAYSAKQIVNDEVIMVPIAGNVIPAETGVLIIGAAGRYAFNRADNNGEDITSLLVGQEPEAPMSLSGYKLYKLTADKTFNLDQQDGSIDCTVTNRAYLRLPASAPAAVKLRLEEAADAIVTPAANIQLPAYNLSGQRVEGNYRGIVIRGGKKIVNR